MSRKRSSLDLIVALFEVPFPSPVHEAAGAAEPAAI